MQQSSWGSVARPVVSQQPAQPPAQPQPFPGAQPIVLGRPASKTLQDQVTINRDQRDANADARAAEATELARQRAEIDREKAEIARRTAAATGGVDRTAQETTAGGHMQTLQINLDLIGQAVRENPKAFAPGFVEAALGGQVGEEFRGVLASPERNVVRQSTGPILESAIYLATGAAANNDQVKRLAAGLIPVYSDGPTELKAKAIRLEAELAKAASIAGPAGIKAQEAIGEVRKLYPLLYGVDAQDVMNPLLRPGTAPEETKLSGDSQRIKVPAEMQAEMTQFLRQNPPGSLTAEAFRDFYKNLTEKYEFGTFDDMEAAKLYADDYNKGRANTIIPSPEKPLEGVQAAIAPLGADPGLVGDVYTGTASAANAFSFGIPELAAGREGREAFNQAREEHSKSTLAGELAGSLLPANKLARGAKNIIGKVIESRAGRELGGEAAAGAVYGGARGYTGSEPENRRENTLKGAGLGAALGAGAKLVIDGAPGVLGLETKKALDSLGKQNFAIPSSRGALPADDITPPRYQALTDDELRMEVRRTEQAIDAHSTQTRLVDENQAMREAIRKEAEDVARGNVNRQERYVAENFRSGSPQNIEQIRADAAARFPTNPDELLQQPAFANRLAAIRDPSPEGMEPLGILQARQERLTNYLAQDGTPKTGKVKGVDLTTPQRMGLGEGEEVMQGLPFVHGQRAKSQADFNRHNAGRVLARVGRELPEDVKPGTEMNDFVHRELSNTYERLRPAIKGKIDQGFDNGIAALRREATKTAEGRALWDDIESTIKSFRREDGTFDGAGYRELSTKLRRYSETWGNNNNPGTTVAMQDMARIAEQTRKQTQALVMRSNPAVGKQLKSLEGAWAHMMRIENASNRAIGANGVYSPDEYLASIRQLDTSRAKGAVARGKGMDQEYAQSAKTVLGGKPAKKTSLRDTFYAGLTVSQTGPVGGALLAAMGAGYTPGVKRVVQAVAEGKLGKTPAAVEKALNGSAAGRKILEATSSDNRKQILAQMLRVKSTDNSE